MEASKAAGQIQKNKKCHLIAAVLPAENAEMDATCAQEIIAEEQIHRTFFATGKQLWMKPNAYFIC